MDRAEAIIAAFDAIMVARGDLGVEIPLARADGAETADRSGEPRAKPAITATDMLDSMRENPLSDAGEA